MNRIDYSTLKLVKNLISFLGLVMLTDRNPIIMLVYELFYFKLTKQTDKFQSQNSCQSN